MRKLKFPLKFLGICSAYILLNFYFRHLGLSPPFGLCLALLLSALASDYGTTVVASRLGGKEGNPLVNLIFKKIGVEKGGLVVMGLFITIVVLVFKGIPPYQQLAFTCAYWLVPINNLVVIKQLKERR